MQIFGVGPLEVVFILIIMVLVLGPKGMVQAAREMGKFISKVVRSPVWRDIVGTSREIRNLPTKIVREAGIEKEVEELKRSMDSGGTPEIYRTLTYTDEGANMGQKPSFISPEDKSSSTDRTDKSVERSPRMKKNPTKKSNKNPEA